MLKKKALFQ